MKITIVNLFGVLALSALLGTAAADDHAKVDIEGDTPHPKMSKEERKEFRDKMREHRKTRRDNRLLQLDTNGDEKVDLNEYLAHAEERFNQLDADGDGFVTKEEARERHSELRKKHRKMKRKMREEIQEQGEQ